MPIFSTNLGQLYQNDCLDILPKIGSETVDMVFADPPFNLCKDYGIEVDDFFPDTEYIEWCKKWLSESIRVLKNGGALFLYNLPKWNIILGNYLMQHLTFRHWIAIEIKTSFPIKNRLYPCHYSLLYFIKGEIPARFNPPRTPVEKCRHCQGEIKDYGGHRNKLNPKGISLKDVWTDICPVRHKKDKHRKANELSEKFLDRVIEIATNEGDLILDPFCGSGVSCFVSENKNRKWIGIEKSDCSHIIERFGVKKYDRRHSHS